MSEQEKGPLSRTIDELEVQGWLARAEFRNPSVKDHAAARAEVGSLARLRDELRLQASLGKLEAREKWEVLEQRWGRLKASAERATDDAGESFHDLLNEIREGYEALRA
jgi:hypothetical protein